MYYPIIDKLKKLTADIASVKDKEPLIIEGTVTGVNNGTWVGNWSDIVSAFNANKPVYFSVTVNGADILIPVINRRSNVAESGILYFNSVLAYGQIQSANVFYLLPYSKRDEL